jgi:hypothetical protein
MSKSFSFVGIVHNTSKFPYYLAAELTHRTLESGLFDHVLMISYRKPCHRLLLPLIGQNPEQFDVSCLPLQMPWHNKQKPENYTKYATALIETSEALQMGLNENFLAYAFQKDIVAMTTHFKPNATVLFIVVDVRSAVEVSFLKNKCAAKKTLFIRLVVDNNMRRDIMCDELDGSHLETYAARANADLFDVNLSGTVNYATIGNITEKIKSLVVTERIIPDSPAPSSSSTSEPSVTTPAMQNEVD